MEHAQGDAHVRGHTLERALVGGDGGKYLGLARREREAAGEIRKVGFGVDGGVVCGRRGAGCRAFRGFRCMIPNYGLSRYFVLGGGGTGTALLAVGVRSLAIA